MSWRFNVHFSHLPLVQRALFTGALCALGLGYAFAAIYIFASHAGRDEQPMLSVQDIVIAYRGSPTGTMLESALKGPMSNMLPPDENIELVDWVRKGGDQGQYEKRVKSIFDKRCITCHNSRNPHIPPLDSYDGVKHTTEQDHGMDLYTLVRVSHIHLFGLTFIFFIVGSIFSHAYMRSEMLKVAIIGLPFLSIILDIASWYLTKLYAPFAWLVIGSGALMGTCFAIQFLVSIYQMWFYRLPPEAEQLQGRTAD